MAISKKALEANQLALKALREQLLRETTRSCASDLTTELMLISDRCAALPDLDLRTPEEIIGFEDFGIPV